MTTTQQQIDPILHRPTTTHPPDSPAPPGGADLLAIGLGTVVAMWTVGYFSRIPGLIAPSAITALLLLAILLGGGFIVGRSTGRGWLGGLATGLIVALFNLMIVGSVLSSGGESGAISPSAWGWIPGTLVVTAALMAVAAATGDRFQTRRAGPVNWPVRLAGVAVAATALLLVAGGLVTGREAGLAVPDWPSSYGYNMVLYPLVRMTGNIYYEHAHRLVGVLVGLVTIVLAIHLWRHDGRRWMRWLVVVAVLAVCVQGIMGGLRVAWAESGGGTVGVEVARAVHETTASQILRVAHGVTGQLFFAPMVAIAVFVSTTWRSGFQISDFRSQGAAPGRPEREGPDVKRTPSGFDRKLTLVLLVVLIAQLVLGAFVRHLGVALAWHIMMAMAVFLIALVGGMRIWGLYGNAEPMLKRVGFAMVLVVMAQVGLGFGALVATRMGAEATAPTTADVIVTSAHQINGAALLALVVMAVLYVRKPEWDVES